MLVLRVSGGAAQTLVGRATAALPRELWHWVVRFFKLGHTLASWRFTVRPEDT